MLAKYRNFSARHTYEKDTKTNITNLKSVDKFISSKKVDAILNVYPNIIKMVINGDTQNIDLSKIKGVKEKTFNKLKKKIE